MKRTASSLTVLSCLGQAQAQETDTYVLHQAVSNRETIVYTRVIRFDDEKHLFHVRASTRTDDSKWMPSIPLSTNG